MLNFQESTTVLNAHTKNVWKPIECTTYISNLCKAPSDSTHVLNSWKFNHSRSSLDYLIQSLSYVLAFAFYNFFEIYWTFM